MTLLISSELHQQLLGLAAASPDAEICGILISDGQDINRVRKVLPAVNIAANPARNFEIDPSTLFDSIRGERAGHGEILGYYHSHPGGPPTPSQRDGAQVVPDGRIWLIIGEGRIAAWRPIGPASFSSVTVLIID
jgi:desampylase